MATMVTTTAITAAPAQRATAAAAEARAGQTMSTFKLHSKGHYYNDIAEVGTTDVTTAQTVSSYHPI